MVIICWSYLTQVLVNMARKHYASKEVFFCGIKFQTNTKIWILSKNSRIKSNNGILLPVAAKFVNRQILYFFFKGLLLDFADGVGCNWVDYLTSVPPGIIRNLRFSDGFRGGAELNWSAWTCLILDAKCGNSFSNLIFCLFILFIFIS